MKENRKCIFSGTFDPPTLGHKAVVDFAKGIFDEVIVAVMVNPQKKPYFTLEERTEMLKRAFLEDEKIKIVFSEKTVADLMQETGANYYVRGIRNTIDFEYENANFFATKKLNPNAIPVYFPCPQELLHVSSSMVKNCLTFEKPIDEYVTKEVLEYIQKTVVERERGI